MSFMRRRLLFLGIGLSIGFGLALGFGAESPPPLSAGKWVEVGREEFNELTFRNPPLWQEEVPDDSTPFSDNGSYFRKQNPSFTPPSAYRLSSPIGRHGFLTLESYSRQKKELKELVDVVEDPANPANRVLRIASPEHTDGTILRTDPLGSRYQICARVGFMRFGTGAGMNGYNGGESNGPWLDGTATDENGFYFGAISRTKPMPHNNLFAHHQRIIFLDSDNNMEGWTEIWDPGKGAFVRSGVHPVMMVAVDGQGKETDAYGPPFLSYAAGEWQESGKIRAADAYKENNWYTVCFTRIDQRLSMKITGDFQYGGNRTYEAVLNNRDLIFHFDDPHSWFLGDPHTNYYEGSLLVDDVVLKVWKPDGP